MEIAASEVSIAVYYLTLAAVLGLVAAKGGRFERAMALTIMSASVATVLSQVFLDQLVPMVPFTAIDIVVLASIVRILHYHRRLWICSAAILQCVGLTIDVFYILDDALPKSLYMALLNFSYYGILASITFGVIRRRIGPPLAPPAIENAKSKAVPSPTSVTTLWLHSR